MAGMTRVQLALRGHCVPSPVATDTLTGCTGTRNHVAWEQFSPRWVS